VLKNADRLGVDIRLAGIYDPATTICAKTFITFVTVTVLAPYVLVADVFETGICH
jgi:hypothetical protein